MVHDILIGLGLLAFLIGAFDIIDQLLKKEKRKLIEENQKPKLEYDLLERLNKEKDLKDLETQTQRLREERLRLNAELETRRLLREEIKRLNTELETKQLREENQRLKAELELRTTLNRLNIEDWVCGGQWNKMEQFLRNFVTVVQASNLDLIVVLNGSLEPGRYDADWKQKQEETHRFVEEIHRHVSYKKKPPPKIWWVPPAYLRSAVRLAFRTLQMKTMCTIEDHHKEVVRFCQKNSFHGIVADDPEYLVFDIPRYFSAQKLKLTFKGSLETVELKLKKVYESLNLPKDKFPTFAALFGNHLLKESDLTHFYSSLKVDLSLKSSVIEKVAEFVRSLESSDVDKIAEAISTLSLQSEEDGEKAQLAKEISEKVAKCLRYYSDLNVPKLPTQKDKKGKNSKPNKKEKEKGQGQKSQVAAATPSTASVPEIPDANTSNTNASEAESTSAAALPSDSQILEGDATKIFSETTETEPDPLPLPTVNGGAEGTDSANSGAGASKSSLEKLVYRINPEIENVCTNRHKNGLMSPYIYHIFKHKEIKLPTMIQIPDSKDSTSKELPKAHDFFRPMRQRIYAILFNLHHLQFLAKQRNEKVPMIQVKETYYCPQTKVVKTDVVTAVEIGWGVPTVERLWLGEKDDCKRKRTRAFLSIMKADKPMVLDSTFVPQQMLVLTCVLRYILSSEKKFLRKVELDAFIAQAFIQDMTDPSIAQDIEVANLTMRGVHLAHLFMEGVEMAMLANDACGAPIPFMLFCPWLFFNGKVFNYVLEQHGQGKSLAEICGYKMDLVFNIDQLRLAATEGIKVQYAQAPNPLPFLFANNAPLMNHVLAPQSRVPYLQNLHLNSQAPASLSQLAAAAAGNRRQMLYQSGALGQLQNPFALSGVSSHFGGGGGLYGNYGTNIGAGGIGAAGARGMTRGCVPIYPHDIPGVNPAHINRQRRPPTRNGGQLEVAGMVVGSWGGNYGPNASLANLSQGVRRIPMGPGAYVSQNQIQMNNLFDQMRISGGKVGGGGRPVHQNASWTQRKNNTPARNQKKPPVKKDTSKPNASANNGATSSSKGSNSNKSKGVSFKDEPQRLEIGAGDAPQNAMLSLEKEEGKESSPGIGGEDQVNHNHDG